MSEQKPPVHDNHNRRDLWGEGTITVCGCTLPVPGVLALVDAAPRRRMVDLLMFLTSLDLLCAGLLTANQKATDSAILEVLDNLQMVRDDATRAQWRSCLQGAYGIGGNLGAVNALAALVTGRPVQ